MLLNPLPIISSYPWFVQVKSFVSRLLYQAAGWVHYVRLSGSTGASPRAGMDTTDSHISIPAVSLISTLGESHQESYPSLWAKCTSICSMIL